MQIVAATGRTQLVTVRGDEEELELQVTSAFHGYVASVALAPNRRPLVQPVLGGEDIEAEQNGPSIPIILPAGTTRVVFVVTETPAGESVRQMIDDANAIRYQPLQYERLREDLVAYLQLKGHKRIAVGNKAISP